MKRKSLLFFLLAAMFLPLAANAQSLFSEGFEGGSMPTGWTQDGPGTWSVGSGDYSASTGAGLGTYNALITHRTTGNVTKLITPEIDLSSVTSATLSFMHVQRSWAGDIDELRVYYRTSSTGTWTQLVEYTNAVASWTTEDDIVLPNTSATYQLAFEHTDNYGYGVGLDQIVISAPSSCPKPAALAVAANGQSATLTWASDASQFAVAHSTDANADPSDNVVTTVSSATYTMNNLALDQDHYFWVRANCSATEQSSWAGPVSVHIGYCVPAPASVDNDGISNVTFGMGDNVVNNDTPKATYADYSSQIGAVQAGVESSIAITFKTSYTYNTYVRVDLDNSLSFDADEIICYGESSSSNPTTLTLNFTIPATQATGDFRMRIGSADSGMPSLADADPCYTSSYACFQDYTLRVLEAPSCLMPTGLAVTTDGRTATATWDGTATSYNIDINGTVYNNVTSPYEFNVELSTTYAVKVQANCNGGETSEWTNAVSITTPDCIGGHVIEYTLNDSFGDGWNGNAIQVVEGCGDIIATLTIESGDSNSGTLTLCGDYYEFIWVNGQYAYETSFTLTEGGTTLFTKPSTVSDGMLLYTLGTQAFPKPTALTAGTPEAHSVALSWTENGTATAWEICVNGDENNLIDANSNPFTLTGLDSETTYTVKVRATNGTTESCWSAAVTFTTAQSSCTKPTNLAESDITTNSATLSWNGTSDSYMLQYRPWYQVGEDQVATAVLTPYTFDLSEYSGTGSIAIRHYDVSDMFQLNVDDIVVTNAAGTTVYSQNFENGITSEISNMDLDGDGYIWGIRQNGTDDMGNPYCNGNSCASSASWDGIALTPDNWMIISGIELGGQITFIARGQDPEWAQENFAVYVSAEADNVEVAVRETTTYQIEDLEPNTPYAWQVKGICSDDESAYASSFFKTKDDVLVFTTAGNWNVVANWKDAEGNTATALPTVDNNVRIDAAAIIPAGVVAVANKATIGTGSITIEDGGQLKQNSATLKVTMEKEITGYGESDGNYYFIATPFSGRALFDEDTDWNHIENMLTGEYDLYAFDATAADGLEWINYKASPTHISFASNNGNEGLIGSEGYLYANQNGTTLNFVGSIGKGINYSETKDYTYNDGAYDWDGWALVGNFFSCNAYLSYVDASGNVLDADFYTLNSDNTYTLMSSNEALPTCTGALMNVSATGKVQYSTEAPAKRTGFLNMNVSRGNKNVGQARLRFGQGHNLGSMSFRNSSRLYMNVDGNDYAVVYTEKQGEMPVSFKADESGTYTLSFNNEEVSFAYLHLIDNMTGNDVDLLQTPSYSFEASTTDYANRFKLVFATGNADDNFAFFSNGSFVINNEGNATVQVIDVNGRILSSENINGCANLNVKAAAGVYMLRLVNGENVKIQKVVVR